MNRTKGHTGLTFNVIWPLNAALAAFRGELCITHLLIRFEKRKSSSLNVRSSLIADRYLVRFVPKAEVTNNSLCGSTGSRSRSVSSSKDESIKKPHQRIYDADCCHLPTGSFNRTFCLTDRCYLSRGSFSLTKAR